MSDVKERKSNKGKRYTREFKEEAVKLITEQGCGMAEVSRNIGVAYSTIKGWKRELVQEDSAVGSATLAAENLRLRKENKRLKMEHEILKKAAAFFARESR